MVATHQEPDLSKWRAALALEAEELRAEIRTKQMDLAQVEERLSLVTKLIEVENRAQGSAAASKAAGTPTSQAIASESATRSNTHDLEGAVEKILRAAAEPLHISRIREALVTQSVPIPGRGDEANIIVRLRRYEDRFTRTARGTYGLAEWGVPALKGKTRRRRRRAAR